MANTRLSPIEKIGYGLGDFGSNVVFQTVIILLPSFYTDVFGLAPAAMGLMFLLVRLLDTVTDPIMGVIADNTNTRWGKFRPYMLWFSVPFAVVFVLTYWTPDLAGNQKLLYAYVTYAALMLLYTVVNIPYCALGGVITADSQERVSANSYRFFLATSAGVLITWYGPTLITYFGKGNDRIGYPWAMAVFGVLAVFAFIGCFALTKERVVEAQPAKKSFWRDVGTLVKNDQWVVVAFLGLVSLVAIVLRAGSAAFYIKCVVGRPDLTAEFLTAGTFAAMIGAAFAAPLTAKLDKGPSYAMLQIIIVIGSVGIYFAPTQNIFLIFGLYILVNFLTQMAAPILFSMAADTADYGEFKTGRRVTGLIFSGFLFAIKLGVAIAGWCIGSVLATYGYDGEAATQTPSAIQGILLSISIFPAIGHFLLLPIIYFYRLSTQRCTEIRQELDARSSR
jgi:GPH family glycoside/pentoside/hexuronide:cation symporter